MESGLSDPQSHDVSSVPLLPGLGKLNSLAPPHLWCLLLPDLLFRFANARDKGSGEGWRGMDGWAVEEKHYRKLYPHHSRGLFCPAWGFIQPSEVPGEPRIFPKPD